MGPLKTRNTFQKFNVLQIRHINQPHTEHQLFIKEHSVKQETEDKPPGRTLYITNIPPFIHNENTLKTVFSSCGIIKSVSFQSTVGFGIAYIVFKDAVALNKALALTTLEPITSNCGVGKWVQEYNDSVTLNQTDELRAKIAEILQNATCEKEDDKKGESKEDDDGWITVTKKGRTPGIARKESVELKLQEKNNKKNKVLSNFYRHQIREGKMNKLAELRENLVKDKIKIAELKQARKFKPY